MNYSFLYILILIVVGSIACTTKEEPYEVHPDKGNYPYINDKVQITEFRRSDNLKDTLYEIKFNEQFIENEYVNTLLTFENKYNTKGDFFSSLSRDFDVVEIKERLIILDKIQQFVYEYDLESGNERIITTPGDGPGSLRFPVSLYAEEKQLYILSGGGRIANFDCSVSCRYQDEILVDNLRASAFYKTDSTYVLTGRRVKNYENNEYSIFEVDLNGNLTKEYGDSYDSNGRWMLDDLLSDRILVDNNGATLQIFSYLPFIYELTTETLSDIFVYTSFNTIKQQYEVATGSLASTGNDFSEIKRVVRIDGSTYLIEILHYKNRRVEDSYFVWDQSKDFYITNFKDKTNYFLTSWNMDLGTAIFTENKLILAKNDSTFIFEYKSNI